MKQVILDHSKVTGESVKTYNFSVVKFQNRFWAFYRFETGDGFHTEIGVCEMASDLGSFIGRHQKVMIPRISGRVVTVDDPRAVVIGGSVFLVMAQGAQDRHGNWCSCVCVVKVSVSGDQWSCTSRCTAYPYGNNENWLSVENGPNHQIIAREKNWSPLVKDNKLHLVYKHNPLTILEIDEDGRMAKAFIKSEHLAEQMYGNNIYGGTNYIDFEGGFLSMFHTFTTDPGTGQRVYEAGWILLNRDFSLRASSIRPYVVASHSEPDYIRQKLEPNSGWKPIVFYPCGLLNLGNELYAVTYGLNDSYCGVMYLGRQEIEEQLSEESIKKY